MSGTLRIAVADDEPDMRDYLERLLPRLGHSVVAKVGDGRALVAACETYHPDLIITDVRMPELNGDDAVREIWRQQRIPAILLSAYLRPQRSDESAQARCSYLTKPVGRVDLEEAIRRVALQPSSEREGIPPNE